MNYANDKAVQMLISILKHNNIKKVVTSPGAMSLYFVGSIQHDSYFETYSCVDERSACYMACGLAEESHEPVVIVCTGATASRNYMPGLTEAYYRKIPILAITCAQHFSYIYNNNPQAIDRTNIPNDIANISVQIPQISSHRDELGANLLINKAILELKHHGGGPVHINLCVNNFNTGFDVKTLPLTRYVDRFEINDNLPTLNSNRIAIFVGAHSIWSSQLTTSVEKFCEKYNALVLCDHTSNYNGKYKIMPNIVFDQDNYVSPLNNFDILIHIGNISGAYLSINAKEVWRVNPDGKLTDAFGKLKYVFEMEELYFFEKYNAMVNCKNETSNYFNLKKECDEIETKAMNCDIPFSNLWIARNTINLLPKDCHLHLAILNSLRSWNYFYREDSLYCFANTGGFGIDGPLSTIIGSSLAKPNNIFFGIVGDLAFFYDLNSLGNRYVGNNIRIILINNGCGTEFHNYSHSAMALGTDVGKYVAADGHYGNKSKTLIKHYAEDLGFEYISAENKDDFLKNIEYFTSKRQYNKPIIFEVFTDSDEESNALKTIRNLKMSAIGIAKNKAKKVLNENTKRKIKKIIGK